MDISTYSANLSTFVRDVRDYYARCGYQGNDSQRFTLPLAMVSYTLQDLNSEDKAELLTTLHQRGFIYNIDGDQITFSERFVSQA